MKPLMLMFTNPFAPSNIAEKHILQLVGWFSVYTSFFKLWAKKGALHIEFYTKTVEWPDPLKEKAD